MLIVIEVCNRCLYDVVLFSNIEDAIQYANDELDNYIKNTGSEDYCYATEDDWGAYGSCDKTDFDVYIKEM